MGIARERDSIARYASRRRHQSSAVINRADQIQSPKMYLVLTTVVGVDPSASAILKEGNELETNWMNQMQELHQSLEVVKNNSENSNVIYRRKVHLEIHQVLRKA